LSAKSIDQAGLEERRHVGLNGEIDVLALTGALRAKERGERGGGAREPALEVRLVSSGLERGEGGILERARAEPGPASRVPDLDLLGAPSRARADQPEGRDRADHEGGLHARERLEGDVERGQPRGGQVVHDDVGRGRRSSRSSLEPRF
jgi:hypothetical protein